MWEIITHESTPSSPYCALAMQHVIDHSLPQTTILRSHSPGVDQFLRSVQTGVPHSQHVDRVDLLDSARSDEEAEAKERVRNQYSKP